MSHETFREQLLDLAYGELPRRAARAVEKHVAGCAECRAELERMRGTRKLMSGLGPVPAPPEGEGILLAAAREAARQRVRPAPILPGWLWGSALAAAGLAAVVALTYRTLDELSPTVRTEQLRARELAAPPAQDDAGSQQPAAAVAAEPLQDALAADVDRHAAPPPPAAPPPKALAKGAPAPAQAAPAAPKPARPAPPAPVAQAAPTEAEEDVAQEAQLYHRGAAEKKEAPAPSADASPMARSAGGAVDKADRYAPPPPPAVAEAPAPAAAANGSELHGYVGLQPDAEQRRRVASKPAPPAAAAAAPAGAEDPIARHARLRVLGRLVADHRTFPGCEGEQERIVEREQGGATVRLVRRGAVGGTAYELELFYSDGGALAAARYREGAGPVREVRLSGAASPGAVPPELLVPRTAAEATLDAPPRCTR
ncbi:MAG: zf-HC2 domain-containing protein [Anaeromyxobacter sp.]